MITRISSIALFLACSILLTQQLSAARITYVDPFATARGGAFTATADNPSAVYYNAAGLTWIEGTNLQASVFAVTLQYEFDGDRGRDEMDSSLQYVPSFFLTHNFEDNPFSVGIGVYVPLALTADWPRRARFNRFSTEFPLSFGLPYLLDIITVRHHIVLAYEVSDTLSVAAGLNYDRSELQANTRPVDYPANESMFGYSLSLLWRPNAQHSFGLTYQSETDATFTGQATYLGLLKFDSKANFLFPDSITLGYSYRPSEKWNFEFNLDWTDWDDFDEMELRGPPLPLPLRGYRVQWESALIWKLGATRYFNNGWHISTGYQFVESSVPDESLLHVVPVSDRHYFSFGVGRKTERWTYQFTYEYSHDPGRTVTEVNYATRGEFKLESHGVGLSAGYSF